MRAQDKTIDREVGRDLADQAPPGIAPAPAPAAGPASVPDPASARDPASAPTQAAWVYLLHCRDGSLYTGWTTDLRRRLAEHNAGRGARYTRGRLPVSLAAALPMADRTAARRAEVAVKALDRTAKLALIARVVAGDPAPLERP